MKTTITMLLGLAGVGMACAQTAQYVAGFDAARRPPDALAIVLFEQTPPWLAQALKGIAEPRTGLGFMKDQGAWYTPFNRPCSSGPYDIRGLYNDAATKD